MALIWVADIGGTNCRLAEFSVEKGRDTLRLVRIKVLPTASVSCEADLGRQFESAFGQEKTNLLGATIALGGPVYEEWGRLTHAPLRLQRKQLQKELKLAHVFLVNDFLAQAMALTTTAAQNAIALTDVPPLEEGVCTIIGPGTGLGVALLWKKRGFAKAFASEAGHMPFPFLPSEIEIAQYLESVTECSPVSCDSILSGRGLEHLYTFCTGEHLEASCVARRIQEGAQEVKTLMARFLGRFCRMMVLMSLCQGGLWVSGGLAMKNQALVHDEAFREELQRKGPVDALTYPIALCQNHEIGLWGAAACFCQEVQLERYNGTK